MRSPVDKLISRVRIRWYSTLLLEQAGWIFLFEGILFLAAVLTEKLLGINAYNPLYTRSD